MIIRSIEIENWRCITSISLKDLPSQTTIIHGPNRAGKSSMFQAVRSCLFDHDHDSGKSLIVKVVPRETRKYPKVVVEFETKGVRYKITKVFSRTKEGTALLERWADNKWVTDVRDPKEASRKVREILNRDTSVAGLNQLLWLDQGTTTLPKMNNDLRKQLEQVLGTLITATDIDFKNELDKRCNQWFTPTRMKHRTGSPVLTLGEEKARYQEELRKAVRKLEESDGLLQQFEDLEFEIQKDEESFQEASKQVAALESEEKKTRARREAHDKAVAHLDSVRNEFQVAENKLGDYHEAKQRLDDAKKKLGEAEKERDAAEGGEREASEKYEEARQKAETCRNQEDEHSETRTDLNDMQKLLQIEVGIQDCDKKIEEAGEHEKLVTELEEKLSASTAPEKKQIESLREKYRKIQNLRAEIEAGGINIIFEPISKARVKATLDGRTDKTRSIPGKQETSWQALQQAEFEIDSFGKIELKRGKEDRDLRKQAEAFELLRNEYIEALKLWGEDPDNDAALDNLNERRAQREQWSSELKKERKKLTKAAPEGIEAYRGELNRYKQERDMLFERSTRLTKWKPDKDDLDKRIELFESRAAELREKREQAEEEAEGLSEVLDSVRKQLSDTKEAVASLRATFNAAKEELKRLGQEGVLKKAVKDSENAVREAEKKVEKTTLTEEEKTIDERLESAKSAKKQREDRLQEKKRTLERYRGELRSTEGLHARRTDAETAVNTICRKLSEEELEADAHKYLKDLFEKCRDSQVEKTVGPVTERVMSWARHLGLQDYEKLEFNDSYFPVGMFPRSSAPDSEPVSFSEESYGTMEQLTLLVRLALGKMLATDEPEVAILDDPLAHSDSSKHRKMLDVIRLASEPDSEGKGKLQIFILTCHPERFDYLLDATQIDFLSELNRRAD